MTKYLLRLIAWSVNRHLYGPRTADVIWSIDTTLQRVERIAGVRTPY